MNRPFALFGLLAALALAACNDPEEPCDSCGRVANLVERGKKEIAAANFKEAVDLCESALEIDIESADARYCIVIGRLGRMSLAINNILERVGSLLPRGESFSPSMNYKPMISEWVEDIDAEMTAIDAHLYELAKVENLQFQIPRFPIHLKFKRIADYYNSNFYGITGEQLPGELNLNAGGTWDRSEILALGAAFNAAMGVLDYGLAHDFNIIELPNSSSLFELVAEVFIINPDLLRFAATEESRAKLHGGDKEKGLSNDMIAVVSYVSGRAEDRVNAAPANPGLKAALSESAAAAATDAVMVWIDDDNDGHPEAVESEIFGEVTEQLSGIRLNRLPIVFSAETLDAVYAFSAALLTNIEQGGDPVSVHDLLEGLRIDVGGLTGIDSLSRKPVPDFVRVSPGAFLKEPLPIRRLLPLLYEDEGGYYSGPHFGMLYDWEIRDYGNSQNRYYSFQSHSWAYTSQMDHFSDLPDAAFQEFTPLSGVSLADDGVDPNASVTSIVYVGLQNPSFGGLLYVDPSSLGGAAPLAEASNLSINETMARLVKYYCFDFGYTGGYDYSNIEPVFRSSCPEGSENE